jgi:acylphosphatase
LVVLTSRQLADSPGKAPGPVESQFVSAGNERREVLYQGHVQGVGFRYTARDIARRFPVAGYVMNLPDGTVRLVAEGSADELDRFLAEVGQAMSGYIRSSRVCREAATGEFSDFRIEH